MTTQRTSPFRLLILLFTLAAAWPAGAVDFTWEGVNYRDVEVIEVDGDQVTLRCRKKEEVTVPMNRLSGFLLKDAQAYKASGKGRKEEVEPDDIMVDQDTFERCWIHGSASDVTPEGFLVWSTDQSLVPRRAGRNGEIKEPKKTKGGAPIYNGIVFVKKLQTGENTKFDKVLWRDGWEVRGLKKIPAFSASKPKIDIPELAVNREWTNSEGKKIKATLKGLRDGKCQFQSDLGKKFTYDLDKLAVDDQILARDAAHKHDKEIKAFKKEHPYVKFD